MKHTLKVTVALILFFFMAQLIGLLIVDRYIDHKKTIERNEIIAKPLPYGFERPEVENQSTSFIYIFIAIILGTLILLALVKFNKPSIWKFWFFLTVWITLSVSFSAFINSTIAAVIALAVALLKLYKPDILIQNLSEIFIYGGLAAVFVPMVNLFAAFMLLIVISVYDYIAVYKTKHMVSLAKFQSQSKVFAGFMIPYKAQKILTTSSEEIKPSNSTSPEAKSKSIAILGGGDIGFTLIFAGVVMKGLMLQNTIFIGFLKALIIPAITTIALLVLLLRGEKGKFYPAMPILSIGCFVGYLVIMVLP